MCRVVNKSRIASSSSEGGSSRLFRYCEEEEEEKKRERSISCAECAAPGINDGKGDDKELATVNNLQFNTAQVTIIFHASEQGELDDKWVVNLNLKVARSGGQLDRIEFLVFVNCSCRI